MADDPVPTFRPTPTQEENDRAALGEHILLRETEPPPEPPPEPPTEPPEEPGNGNGNGEPASHPESESESDGPESLGGRRRRRV